MSYDVLDLDSMYKATFLEDRIDDSFRRIGTDRGNLFDPLFYEYKDYTADNNAMFTPSFSTENVMDKKLLWAAATKSPQGHFITFVASVDAFRNEWRYVEAKGYSEVEEELLLKLLKLAKDYKIKQVHTMAAGTARALGKCIVAKVKQKSYGYKDKPSIKLRIFPVFDWEIEWDQETGEPIQYNPMGTVGIMWHRFSIPAKDAVLYVHKMDPFGNGYQGIPEVYTIYNQIKWLANIEKGWAEAMDSRGISMLQMKIPGYHPDEYEKWKEAYGDPSNIHVIFSDDDVEVVNIPGVTSQFSLDDTLSALTKETAASSGMAQSRIDGSQRGQVSGTQNDTDNYYSTLNTIQEEFETQLIELHEFLDPSVIGKFDISWDVEPKTDKFSKAQIRATNIATIQSGLDFFTYNEALELLDLPKIGENGNIPASIFIYRMQKEEGMVLPPAEKLEGGESKEPEPKPAKPQKVEKDREANPRRADMKKPPKDDDPENRGGKEDRESNVQQCKAMLVSGRRCLRYTTNPSGFCYLHEGGKRGGRWGSEEYQREAERKGKMKIATKYRQQGDSYAIINNKLKQEFKSGLSFTTLKEIDSEVTKERQKFISEKLNEIRNEHPDWSRNKCVVEAIEMSKKYIKKEEADNNGTNKA